MNLGGLLDINLLIDHLNKGNVSANQHPLLKDLWIYNYTHNAQHDNVWDNVTEHCRGLICKQLPVDDASYEASLWGQEIIARPFRKFFNLNTSFRPETQEVNLPAHSPDEVIEKLDGSLGILYKHNGQEYIATRGSFTSDQAKWANEWYHANRPEQYIWPDGYTPLFEIIYKANRIVVDYEYEGLVLLGLVEIKTGFELPRTQIVELAREWGLRFPRNYAPEGMTLQHCKNEKQSNFEGYVLQYWVNKAPIPLRLKVKTEEYTRLHKIITGTNPKGIWEHLMNGYDPDAIWANTNPQFFDWATGWINTFNKLFKGIEDEAIKAFGGVCIQALLEIESLRQDPTKENSPKAIRKSYAMAILSKPVYLRPILFHMLDGKDYKVQIWKALEPKIEGKDAYIKNADKFEGL